MDKDLEIIKKEKENYLFNHGIAEEPPEIKAIIIAAERMDMEIEALKKEMAKMNVDDPDWFAKYIVTNVNKFAGYHNEISRLKAELEKRPDIVKCGECKNWHPIEFLENTYSLAKLQGPCMLRKDNTFFYENDFCSNGQR